MERRALGNLHVSVVGIGTNNFGMRLDQTQTDAVVHAALDAGINFFDTADIYGDTKSEVQLGVALGARRDQAVIATKFGMGQSQTGSDLGLEFSARPDYVRSACEASLRRLGTDYIDLYQLHYPDEKTPLEDTVATLQSLIDEGKIRNYGCSNFNSEQLHAATTAARAGARVASVQNQYSLLSRDVEEDVLATCDQLNVGLLPYYPLANGMLTGKFDPDAEVPADSRLAKFEGLRKDHWFRSENLDRVRALRAYAQEIDTPLLDLAFGWLLHHSEVRSVIAGASNPTQVYANAAAAISISDSVRQRLDELTA